MCVCVRDRHLIQRVMPSDGYVPSCKERRKRIVSRVSEPIRQLTFSVLKFLFIIVSKEKKNNVATSEREPPADAFIVEFHALSSNEKKKIFRVGPPACI